MNCLAYALTRWHTDGGYLVLRKSDARATPHVLHISGARDLMAPPVVTGKINVEQFTGDHFRRPRLEFRHDVLHYFAEAGIGINDERV